MKQLIIRMKQSSIQVKQLHLLFAISFIVCFSALSISVSAADFDYYGINIIIQNDKLIKNEINLEFDNSITHLDYSLDFKAENLRVSSNFYEVDCRIVDTDKGSDIICDFIGEAEDKRFLRLFFDTTSGVKKTNNQYIFSATYDMPVSVDEIVIKVKLPENAALIDIFPPNPRTTTYNKTISLLWEKEDLADNRINFSVKYSVPVLSEEFYMVFIITITLIVIIVMIAMVLYIKKSPKTEPVRVVGPPKVDTIRVVTSVLREDEKKIVDILEKHEGRVIQKILVRETDFSKAKVSRLVKNLKERGIINVEPVGRTTKVTLKIKPIISEPVKEDDKDGRAEGIYSEFEKNSETSDETNNI